MADDAAKGRDWGDKIAPFVVPLIILGFIGWSIFSSISQQYALDIVVYFSTVDGTPKTLKAQGRVLNEGDPVPNAQVWVILRDYQGNRFSPSPGEGKESFLTKKDGSFTIEQLPPALGQNAVSEATVYAKAVLKEKSATLRGREVVRLSGDSLVRVVSIWNWRLLPLPIIFFLSTLVPFIALPNRLRYVLSLFLTFLFTVSMIVYISVGLGYVHTTSRLGEVLSLGFASVFHGTFAPTAGSEWLVSLTSPDLKGTAGNLNFVRGFGAPLWVVLVAVIGGGLLTVSILVNEITHRPDFDGAKDPTKLRDEVRQREEMMVRHQFFILFSPLGAIFVYQTLLLADAASSHFTVALAALGAGASLNVLLDKAVVYSKKLIAGAKPDEKPQGS